MWLYLIKRLITSLPVLLGLSLFAFFIVRLIPGDTATAILGLRYTPESAAALRAELGLDENIIQQYLIWLGRLLQGDLGVSAVSGQPVLTEIQSRLTITGELALFALLIGTGFGLFFGLWSAISPTRWRKGLADLLGVLGVSVPNFWLGTCLIMVFALLAGWLPSSGYVAWSEGGWAHLKTMIMPSLALGLAVTAVIARMSQASMDDVLGQPYCRTALAKGLSRGQMIRHHALKNTLIPVITVIGLQAGSLLGGSIVIEQVFALPGFGQLVLQAVGNRDYPLLQGIILTTGSFFIGLNIIIDLLYKKLDPRIGGHV
jgi:peptide/nickel transport system permease protein